MKQKDIALIIVVIAISGLTSFFIARVFFLKPAESTIKAEYVRPITSEFTHPDPKYFNANAINPTQLIQIGDGTNAVPYSTGQ